MPGAFWMARTARTARTAWIAATAAMRAMQMRTSRPAMGLLLLRNRRAGISAAWRSSSRLGLAGWLKRTWLVPFRLGTGQTRAWFLCSPENLWLRSTRASKLCLFLVGSTRRLALSPASRPVNVLMEQSTASFVTPDAKTGTLTFVFGSCEARTVYGVPMPNESTSRKQAVEGLLRMSTDETSIMEKRRKWIAEVARDDDGPLTGLTFGVTVNIARMIRRNRTVDFVITNVLVALAEGVVQNLGGTGDLGLYGFPKAAVETLDGAPTAWIARIAATTAMRAMRMRTLRPATGLLPSRNRRSGLSAVWRSYSRFGLAGWNQFEARHLDSMEFNIHRARSAFANEKGTGRSIQ